MSRFLRPCSPLIVFLHELEVQVVRTVYWLLARELIQINPVQLCPPIIYTLLSDNYLFIGVRGLVYRGYKRTLCLESALTMGQVMTLVHRPSLNRCLTFLISAKILQFSLDWEVSIAAL